LNRQGEVFFREEFAGLLTETEDNFIFQYDPNYLKNNNPKISITLPLQAEPFISKTMFPFFDGLIPEGWLLNITTKTWKLNPRDRMGLILACCKDCIGAVSVREVKKK